MVNIIGREEELKQFDRVYRSTQAQFVVVYGRRRDQLKNRILKELNLPLLRFNTQSSEGNEQQRLRDLLNDIYLQRNNVHCERCGHLQIVWAERNKKCHMLHGQNAEDAYVEYITGKRSYMDITLELRR